MCFTNMLNRKDQQNNNQKQTNFERIENYIEYRVNYIFNIQRSISYFEFFNNNIVNQIPNNNNDIQSPPQ